MADRTSRDGSSRRQAFRRVRADAGLPDEYLERLEQKRKQLDESIHKYIASKERDFKTFERELQQQYRQDKQEQSQDGSSKTARRSSGSTSNGGGSPQLRAQQEQQQQQQSVVNALLAAGVNQEHIGQPLSVAVVDDDGSPRLEAKSAAGLIDRRASIERDKEFVGVFTPAFLPALDNKASSSKTPNPPERTESAPPGQSKEIEQPTIIRAHSDHLEQAQAKRPVQLQLTHRTSSSGSSADGKLTSALKSPTQGLKTKRKRVSLAVGDTIVKPSDSVPTTLLNNNRTPSHSRRRSQPAEPEREQSIDATIANGNGNGTKEVEVQTTSPQVSASLPVESTTMLESINEQRTPAAASLPNGKSAVAPSSPLSRPPARPPATIDPDGDLFDLEEEDMAPNGGVDNEAISESEDGIAGRVDRRPAPSSTDDNTEELSPEASPEEDRAEHVEFIPGSAVASQQPTLPGFRRPSVAMDPIYAGANYDRAEHNAVVNEIYGSSYDRPRRSFTSGSLGESFMARNAQHMRARSGSKSQEQQVVR